MSERAKTSRRGGAWSIRRKLTLVTTGVTLFALAVLGSITTVYEWYAFRDALSRELTIQADIIGANSVVALSFEAVDDTGGEGTLVTEFDAADTLKTLRANKHIISACIYSKSGKVRASYTRQEDRPKKGVCPDHPGSTGAGFGDGFVTVTRPIVEPDGETVGTVFLKSDLEELYSGVKDHAVIITSVALACFLVAFLLAVWLQHGISSPVMSLARTAEAVSKDRDYSVRAEGQSQDEVGLLVFSFNEMLSTIQKRDSELQVLTEQLAQSNAKLGEYSSSLEEKVEQRTADLARAIEEAREARDKALQASVAKSQFLANMSHEIRTPLNAIIGLTNLGLRADPPPKIDGYLTKVASSSRSLLAIVNDVLDFSKIEARKLELSIADFDLRVLLAHLTDVVGDAASRKGVEFLVSIARDVPCALKGDALRLKQVLTNLAGNAVKFTEQGTVLARVELVKKTDARVTIRCSVKDTGIGIDEEVIPKLFDSFSQADGSTSRKYGGTGLGLTISRRLVQLMGGEIHVESEVGEGSTFSFTLEVDRQPEEQEIQHSPTADLIGTRVLVVDDNDHAREVLSEMVESFSFRSKAVSSGEDSLEELAAAAAAEQPYNLVLLDWSMPGMDGIETAKRIEQDPRIRGKLPKLIMVTAHGREEVIDKADAAGLDGFIVKPVSHSMLFDAIMEAFGKEIRVTRSAVARGTREVAAAKAIRGRRVLLAEDVEINQEIVQEILQGSGIDVTVASDGKEAIRLLEQSGPFDAVLMDVQMPIMDGYEATKALRNDPRFADLPIIALTAHATRQHREICLAAGMNDHVTKPIDSEELLTALASWIAPEASSTAISAGAQERGAGDDLPDRLAGINLEAALKRVSGNRRLLRKLLESFRTKYDRTPTGIREALGNGDREGAKRLAHTIKGLAGNIGAEEVQQRALAVENAIDEKGDNSPETMLEPFARALAQVVTAIESLPPLAVEGGPATSPPEADEAEELAPRITELLKLLASNRLDAKRGFSSLKHQLAAKAGASELEKIEAMLDQLNFKGAHKALGLLAKRLGLEE